MHFGYNARADRDAPLAGVGDEKSWFLYYKWGPGVGVTWLPCLEEMKEGDTLWFFIDSRLVGRATVRSVEENYSANRFDCYFDADAVETCEPTSVPRFELLLEGPSRFAIPEDVATVLINLLSKDRVDVDQST